MKNGFLLVGDYSDYEKEMDLVIKMFNQLNVSIELVNFNDISVLAYEDFNGKITVNGELKDCPDFVIVSAVDERDQYQFKAVLRMFETLGVKCINNLNSIEKTGDKIYSFQYAKQKVPEVKIPKTMLISQNTDVNEIESEISFPLVLKIMDGNQGRGVSLINSKEELENILNIVTASEFGQELMVQEAIMSSKGKDIRIVIGGGEFIHAFVRSNDNDFKSNLHQGGSIERFDAPESLIETSVKLTEAFGLELGSIDYLFGDNPDEFYLCELNSIPGISYLFEAKDNGDSELIKRFMKIISEILK